MAREVTLNLMILTPTFTGGHNQQAAEWRAPTVRGQARWWFRALGATREMEAEVFGAVGKNTARASAVKIRIVGEPRTEQAPVLPHKGRQGHPRSGLLAGLAFSLHVFENPLRKQQPDSFDMALVALHTWALLGGMGFRSNRGAGSLWPAEAPADISELMAAVRELQVEAARLGLWTNRSKLGQAHIDVLNQAFTDHESAREVCTDTVVDRSGVLGFVQGRDRLASPLKVKVIFLPKEREPHRVLRVGFPLNQHPADAGIRLLASKGKRLGGPGTPVWRSVP